MELVVGYAGEQVRQVLLALCVKNAAPIPAQLSTKTLTNQTVAACLLGNYLIVNILLKKKPGRRLFDLHECYLIFFIYKNNRSLISINIS